MLFSARGFLHHKFFLTDQFVSHIRLCILCHDLFQRKQKVFSIKLIGPKNLPTKYISPESPSQGVAQHFVLISGWSMNNKNCTKYSIIKRNDILHLSIKESKKLVWKCIKHSAFGLLRPISSTSFSDGPSDWLMS